MAPFPGVFAHTKNLRPRGRSLARNPWLPLRSHETVSQMNQKSLKGHGSWFVLLIFGFAAFLQHYQTGSQKAELLLGGLPVRGERGCGILGSRQQRASEPCAAQRCD